MPRTPRLARQDNDFNACNPKSSWIWKSKFELRAELRRRGLPDTGAKDDLIARIQSNNDFNLTAKGQDERFERRLKVIKKAAMADIVPFNRFQALPTEIRLMIWELSLPGPRTLCISGSWASAYEFDSGGPTPSSLEFQKYDNNQNPAALFVCQESRAVALKRYRLCFGTPHVYADLAGEDILFFGLGWQLQHSFTENGILWRLATKYDRRGQGDSSALADLRLVKRIALSPRMLRDYNDEAGWALGNGSDLRVGLQPFSALKELLLVGGGMEGLWSGPGHVIFEEKDRTYGLLALEDSPPEVERHMESDLEMATRIRNEFIESATTEENEAEKDFTVPEVRIVSATIITAIPGDNWDFNRGEPFYLPEDQLEPATEARRSSRIQRF